jgi:hypothetical protein
MHGNHKFGPYQVNRPQRILDSHCVPVPDREHGNINPLIPYQSHITEQPCIPCMVYGLVELHVLQDESCRMTHI